MALSTYSVEIDDETLAVFGKLAKQKGQDGNGMVEQLIHEFVQRESETPEYDAWFRAQVEEALRESQMPGAALIPHDEVMRDWQRQRALLIEEAAGKAG